MSSAITNYTNSHEAAVLKFKSLVTKETVDFAAFVTSFSQTFNSNWTSETVYGRNDPIGNFQGTQRAINVGWDIPSGNLAEAKTNLKKINKLVQMLYPFYAESSFSVELVANEEGAPAETRIVGSNALSLSKPPLIRLQYGNLIRAVKESVSGDPMLLGWIGNLSWTPAVDMGMFFDASGKNQYPKVISLSIDFTVQHEHTLGTTSEGGTPAGFPFGGG
jgi:hypothetical protein